MLISSRDKRAATKHRFVGHNKTLHTGPLDAQTFRNVAKAQQPMVVNIRTESKAKNQDLSEMFGGGGGGGRFGGGENRGGRSRF